MIFETFEKNVDGKITDKMGMRLIPRDGFKSKDYAKLHNILQKIGFEEGIVIQNAKQMNRVFQANTMKEVLDTDYDAMKRYAAITGETERDIAARNEQLSRMSEEARTKAQSANFNANDLDAWYSAQNDAIKYSAMSTKEFTNDLNTRKAKLQAFVNECNRITAREKTKSSIYGTSMKSDADIRTEAMANLGDFDDDLKGYAKSMELNGDAVDNWSQKQTAAFDNAAKGAKKFSATAKAVLANVGLEMGIALAIVAIGKAWQWANDKFKITPAKKIEAMENAVNNYNEALSSSTENIETIKSLESEFNRLAQGVNEAGENIGLSTDEYARYNEIVSELVKINPELVQGYTDEGNAIINRNTAIQEGIELQEEYANKATRDYVNSGADILKGARTNANRSLKDAQKAAKELGSMSMQIGAESGMSFGKAFSKSLQGEAALGDSIENKVGNALNNAFVEGGTIFGHNQEFQAVVSDYLGYEVDLASASISTLRKVDKEFEGIIAHAKDMGYSNTSIKDFEYQYQNFHDAFSEIDADYQPIIDWLNGVANLVNSEGESIMSSVPESMQSAFQAGLEEIAYAGGSDEFMKNATKDFADALSEVGEIDEYVDAVETAEEAQEDFMDSSRSRDEAEEYRETVKEQSDALKELADKYRDAGDAATAAALDFKATEILNFATENVMTLTEAFNPLIDKFEEARGAKEKWDAAMEASGDYDTAIDSFKEVYDEIIDGEDNKGNGSRGFWTGAEQMLGTTKMIELGSFSKVNAEIKELKTILSGGESGARAFFKRLYDCRDALNDVTDGAVKFNEATGEVSFDFDEDKWAEYADALGVSEELLSAMVDMSRQWTDIDLGNIDTIKTAIEDMDSTEISDGGEYYQLFSTVWECAAAAGYSLEEFNDRVDDMEKAGIHLIKVDDFFKEDSIDEATDKLIEMNNALGSKNGEKYTVNADAIIAQLFKMGVTAEDTTRILEEMQEAGYSFNPKNFKKGADEDMDDYVADYYSDMSEGSEDFTERITSGIDDITNSIDQLCIALGSLPANWADKVTAGIDDVESRLNKAAKSKSITNTSGKTDQDSIDSRETSLKGIYDKIDAQEEYINQLESTGKADAETVQAARDRLADLKAYADDLLDDGLLNGSINIDTSVLESDRLKELLGGEDSKEYELVFKAATSGTTEELLETVGNLDKGIRADVIVELVKSGAFDNFLGELGDDDKNIIINAIVNGSGDVDELVGVLKTVEDEEVRTQIIVDLIQAGSFDDLLDGLNDEQKEVIINTIVEGEGDAEQLNNIISKLPEDKQTEVRAEIDDAIKGIGIVDGKLAEVPEYHDTIFNVKEGSKFSQTLSRIASRIQNAISEANRDGTVELSADTSTSTNTRGHHTPKGSGGGHLGTPQSPNYRSHSSFPSMAKGGRLGPRGNGGLTLTGELGTELVWIPSESRSFLVGQYGPEMVNLPGDAVVYPAEETRKIIGDAIHPSRLRFGTGSMAKGNMQFGSMGDANGSMSIYGTGGITNGKDKTKKKVKASVDTYEKELARLDHLLEMGYINEKEYYDKLKELYKDHKSALKKDVEANREALEKKRQARIDAYEHEKENLEYKLDRGTITEAKYYTELEKLGKRYFKKDGKVRKGYLDEYRQWLQDKRQAAEDAYKAQQDKLDHQLEMGDISEADYYTKLQKAYDKYKKDMSKEQKRQAKEDIKAAKFAAADAAIDDLKYKLEKGIITQKEYYNKLKEVHKKYATSDKDEKQDRRLEEREAWIDSYEADVATLDAQLARGIISQKDYYDDLVALGKDYYTKDGKIRQGYLEEWRQWKEKCMDAQAAYVDNQKDLYNYQLERGIIDEEQLYNQTIALHNDNPTNDPAQKRERRLEEDELWLNIYESKVGDLDDQLALGLITEEEYFNALTALGDTYLKDKKKFTDEYTDHLQEENDARQEAYEVAQEILDKQLENGEISVKEYNEQSATLVGKWLTTDGLKDEAEDAGESIADNIMSGIEKEIDDIGSIIEAKDLGVFDSWKNGESPIKLWDDMIDKLKEYYDLGLISEKEYHDLFTQCMDERKSQYEENQNQLDTVIDLIENALRQEANDYIDSLNKQVDAYNEIIDAKKESLSLTQKELDYQDDLNSSANEITKLQSEIALLKHDDSRAGQAKLAEKQAELAEKQRERDKMVRDETVSKTEENLNKQSELFTELIQKEIDKTNVFLNNQAAVLEMVGKIIETVPEDELREWLIAYNGEHGDGMISTVDKAMGDLSGLREKYGSDIGSIVEKLQKGIDVNVTGGIIKVEDTDYDETVAEIDSKTHHAGLAAGFTGDGADLKQNEVWRKLTDDELVLNRADQLRLGQDMTILQSIKDAYSGMGASLAQSAGISSFPTTIEVSVSTPITIQGNATPEAVDRLEAMGDHIANTTLDKLANALQIKGISTSASSNMRKGN